MRMEVNNLDSRHPAAQPRPAQDDLASGFVDDTGASTYKMLVFEIKADMTIEPKERRSQYAVRMYTG